MSHFSDEEGGRAKGSVPEDLDSISTGSSLPPPYTPEVSTTKTYKPITDIRDVEIVGKMQNEENQRRQMLKSKYLKTIASVDPPKYVGPKSTTSPNKRKNCCLCITFLAMLLMMALGAIAVWLAHEQSKGEFFKCGFNYVDSQSQPKYFSEQVRFAEDDNQVEIESPQVDAYEPAKFLYLYDRDMTVVKVQGKCMVIKGIDEDMPKPGDLRIYFMEGQDVQVTMVRALKFIVNGLYRGPSLGPIVDEVCYGAPLLDTFAILKVTNNVDMGQLPMPPFHFPLMPFPKPAIPFPMDDFPRFRRNVALQPQTAVRAVELVRTAKNSATINLFEFDSSQP